MKPSDDSSTSAPIRVCLLWHGVDSGNLGVRALTEAQIHLVARAAERIQRDIEFEIVGWAASSDPGPFRALGVKRVTPVNGRSLLSGTGVRAAFRRSDIVLDIGEGDSFSDIYGFKRLLYFCVTKLFAQSAGRTLVLSPQTLGPFTRWWSMAMSDACLRRAAHVFPRDGLSLAYLKARNLGVPFDEIVDVAFELRYTTPPRDSADVIRVGVNVSGLLWTATAATGNRFSLSLDYRALTRRVLHHFSQLDKVELFLVPHVISGAEVDDDDAAICRSLCAEFPTAKLAPFFSGPSAAKSFISSMDFFTGARMHACIAAVSSGVPVVPLAYSRKFTGLFSTIEYPHVADCQKHTEHEVFYMVTRTFAARQTLGEQIRRGNEIARERLDVYVAKLSQMLRIQ